MGNYMSPAVAEVGTNVAGGALVAGGLYGLYHVATEQSDATKAITSTALEACQNDPAMREAAAEAMGRYIGTGQPVAGDVCNTLEASSNPLFNVARNAITDHAATSDGHYADLLNSLGERLSDSMHPLPLAVAGLALGVSALLAARSMRIRRHGLYDS